MLGWVCNRRFWDRSWNIIFNQFFEFPHFGQLVGSYKIMKGRLLCCQQAKDKGTTLQVICIRMAYYSVITTLGLHW
jgi:hypothetical protein